MALEKISKYKKRKFAAGSRPANNTIVNLIYNCKIYGEQIGSDWYVDEYRDPTESPIHQNVAGLAVKPPEMTGNTIADKILQSIEPARLVHTTK